MAQRRRQRLEARRDLPDRRVAQVVAGAGRHQSSSAAVVIISGRFIDSWPLTLTLTLRPSWPNSQAGTSNNAGWEKDPQTRLLVNDGKGNFQDVTLDVLPGVTVGRSWSMGRAGPAAAH